MYICHKSFLDYPEISLLAKSEVHKLPKILQPLGCECKIKNHFTNNNDRQCLSLLSAYRLNVPVRVIN